MMKIMMIEVGGWGGLCHYTYNLCQALTENYKIVLSTGTVYELEDFKRKFSINKIFKNDRGYLRNIIRLLSAVFKEDPDIVHFQDIFSVRKDWILFKLLRFLGISVVLTVHNVFPHEESEKKAMGMKSLQKSIYASCDALIAHCKDSKAQLVSNFGIEPEKIFVVPHGNYLFFTEKQEQSVEELQSESREALGLSKQDKVVLCFGAIREYKGIDRLIPAFSKLIDFIPEAKLIIAGPADQSIALEYKKLVKQYSLQMHVLFEPKYFALEEIPKYFYSADIAVFPYLHSYGSGALHLAFAFSLPAIATTVGIFPEMVKEGMNGYLVPPENSDALTEAINKLLMDPQKIKEMGAYARDFVEKNYSWQAIAQQTTKVYKRIR